MNALSLGRASLGKGALVVAGLLGVADSNCKADDGVNGITAVSSKVSADYVRNKLPDGSFRAENYAFGQGGSWGGEIKDETIDPMHFTDVARVIAPSLATQNYRPARDPGATKLLVMVYWGTTAVPESMSNSVAVDQFRMASVAMGTPKANTASKGYHALSSGNASMDNGKDSEWSAAMIMLTMVNRQRDRADFANALMLGYDSAGVVGTEYGNYVRGTALRTTRDDLVAEIEENRYFVVLMAYDFQLLWKQKKHKLLWETRFSISERRNQFDKALPAMARYASRYFGQPSDGLKRMRISEGTVDVLTPTLIEFMHNPSR